MKVTQVCALGAMAAAAYAGQSDVFESEGRELYGR